MEFIEKYSTAIVAVVLSLVNGAFAWVVWSLHRSFVSVGRHDELEGRVREVEESLAALEEQLAHLPTREDIHQLNLALSTHSADMKVMTEQLRGQERVAQRMQLQVDRLDDFLRSSK